MKKNVITNHVLILIFGLSLGFVLGLNLKSVDSVKVNPQISDQAIISDTGHGMEGAMGDMMLGLSGLTGEAFDQAFLSQMIIHHEGAVAMAEAALENAKHSELKNMANEIISAQTKEIEQMRKWQKIWHNH
jgi:uncharacterized protein (DUF305 family)